MHNARECTTPAHAQRTTANAQCTICACIAHNNEDTTPVQNAQPQMHTANECTTLVNAQHSRMHNACECTTHNRECTTPARECTTPDNAQRPGMHNRADVFPVSHELFVICFEVPLHSLPDNCAFNFASIGFQDQNPKRNGKIMPCRIERKIGFSIGCKWMQT